MNAEFEITPVRLYFHCGWAIQLDPSFEAEIVDGGETLRMFDPEVRREVSLSSMRLTRNDGLPFKASDMLGVFPREMTGLHFEHTGREFAGRALWMFGESDTSGPSWVLMAIMVAESAAKVARCTIVCRDESDRDWALDTWRSIALLDPPR